MQGDYRGDFTRDTFNPKKHFLRVLSQQGRVTLDADFNEQMASLLHYLQTLAEDLIGPHGGPADVLQESSGNVTVRNLGFEIITTDAPIDQFKELSDNQSLKDLLKNSKPPILIGKGRYYVHGILCENEDYVPFGEQIDYRPPKEDGIQDGPYLIYLDVWERHITYIEDDSIREVALGGPDTASRSKVIWQVKTTNNYWEKQDETYNQQSIPSNQQEWKDWVTNHWPGWLAQWQPDNRGMLKARVKPQQVSTDPCITSPESRYRGAENQLYRVEIHRRGPAWDGVVDQNGKSAGNANDAATFKWSRDNGSVVFPIRNPAGTLVTLEHLGRDRRLSLQPDDWVEVVDDDYVLQGSAGALLQVERIDRDQMQVILKASPSSKVGQDPNKHPLLRRWDHKRGEPTESEPQLGTDGALLVEEGKWLTLEDGVEIFFTAAEANGPNHNYRTGDYWLIPARTASGDVEWPGEKDAPSSQPPHGVNHHYAPLAIVGVDSDGKPEVKSDLRRQIKTLWDPVPQAS